MESRSGLRNRHSAPDTRLWSCLIGVGGALVLFSLALLVIFWMGGAFHE